MQSPLENSPEHIIALGTIAARWATLDTTLVVILGKLIGNDAAAEAIYFSSNSTQLRIDCLKAVALRASKLPPEVRDKTVRLLDSLHDLWNRRNALLHTPAVASSATPDAVYSSWVRRPLRKPSQEFRPMPVTELRQHADRLSEIASELFETTYPELVRASREVRAGDSGSS